MICLIWFQVSTEECLPETVSTWVTRAQSMLWTLLKVLFICCGRPRNAFNADCLQWSHQLQLKQSHRRLRQKLRVLFLHQKSAPPNQDRTVMLQPLDYLLQCQNHNRRQANLLRQLHRSLRSKRCRSLRLRWRSVQRLHQDVPSHLHSHRPISGYVWSLSIHSVHTKYKNMKNINSTKAHINLDFSHQIHVL